MHIANPIYDTVFKFMMSDSRVAKTLLSAIIGEKIIDLDFSATEYTLKKDVDKKNLNRTLEQITICRLDFAAKIETETGNYKTVLIELQKAKLSTDIMRFRRYLGTMYQNPENTYNKKNKKARQIYCIYFLNYDIGLLNVPVIQVDHIVRDLITGQELPKNSEFIESLNHKSWIIQVEFLRQKRRNDLENLLSVFDQSNKTSDQHILNIDENQFPEEHRIIIRKLREACESEKVRKEMQMEDDFLNELLERDELIAKQEQQIIETKKAIKEKEKAIKESKKAIKEKDKTIKESKKTIEESKRTIEEKNKELAKKDALIAKLLNEKKN